MLKTFSKLFDTNARDLKKLDPIIQQINDLESEFEDLKKKDFAAKTAEFKLRLTRGETLDDILPEAFALVREASKRTMGMRHYDVQLIASVAFHQGKVGEQRTGEGKTLAATPALYLNALTEKGVHLITVNDYLAQRDAGWNGPLFDLLGISVGVIIHSQSYIFDDEHKGEDRGDSRLEKLRPVSRKEAYAADITYGTSNEFGFDYLRDNMAQSLDRAVQREHHFAIVDEVDSVLIDEARTPLIISAPDTEPTEKYIRFKQIISQLNGETDYEVDEKLRTAVLTDMGIKKIEKILKVDNLYEKDYDTLHHVEQSLKAKSLFNRDKEYVVKDGQVIIVDDHTGRLMHGRRYSDGLHQAIEAKEGVSIQRESKTLATISLQNYFRMYEKLAGMTGTAETEAEEFTKIYGMEVLVVPTNRPVQRLDHPDVVYKTKRAKYSAIVQEVAEKFKQGQPVLLGTKSIEHNDIVSKYLKRKKIPHKVLNAKNHEQEAQIIADAGKIHAVTVATNIAGRGVDIVLGGAPPEKLDKDATEKQQKQYEKDLETWKEEHQRALDLGGLHVIGTERHESRRIDNQLRGRSGRQGDPGSSRFYVALDDEIMRIFGGEQVARLMTALKIPEDQPIEAKLVSRSIASAQEKVEGFYFDQRKSVVEYDDVLNKQREVVYKRRRSILETDLESDAKELHERILKTLEKEIEVLTIARAGDGYTDEEINAIVKEFIAIVPMDDESQSKLVSSLEGSEDSEKIVKRLKKIAKNAHANRLETFGETDMAKLERFTLLKTIDDLWIHHLDRIQDLRQGIRLRGGQEQSLAEYKKEAYDLFESLIATTNSQVARRVLRTQIVREQAPTIDLSKALEQHQTEDTPKQSKPNLQEAAASQTDNPFAKALAQNSQRPVVKDTGIKKAKVGRNDPCPCGSGLKWKKCGLIGAPEHKV